MCTSVIAPGLFHLFSSHKANKHTPYILMKHLSSITHLQFRSFLVDKLLYVGILLLPSGLSFQSFLSCLHEVSSYLEQSFTQCLEEGESGGGGEGEQEQRRRRRGGRGGERKSKRCTCTCIYAQYMQTCTTSHTPPLPTTLTPSSHSSTLTPLPPPHHPHTSSSHTLCCFSLMAT